MKTYQVRITCAVTMSADIQVTADSLEDAEEKALAQSGSLKMELDDGNEREFYVSNIEGEEK